MLLKANQQYDAFRSRSKISAIVVNYIRTIVAKTVTSNVRLVKFSVVGALGFLIDTGVLYACLYIAGFGYYFGRLVSYLFAATVTWYFHRIYTFPLSNGSNKKRQLASFIIFNSVGGAANFMIYAYLIINYELCREFPVLAVGLGAVSGLLINFYLSKRIVFRV